MDIGKKIVTIETKSGIKETDIRPMIKKAELIEREEGCALIEAVLCCGEPNLKPELFVKVIEETGIGKAESFKIHRKALLDADKKKLIKFQG